MATENVNCSHTGTMEVVDMEYASHGVNSGQTPDISALSPGSLRSMGTLSPQDLLSMELSYPYSDLSLVEQ